MSSFKRGDNVRVNNPRFKGYGVCQYFTYHQRELGGNYGEATLQALRALPVFVGVLLENGNVRDYELDTVAKVQERLVP